MTPTLATVTRDFLALSDEEQSRFRDVVDLLRGAITLEDVEEVAELVEPAPKKRTNVEQWRDVPVTEWAEATKPSRAKGTTTGTGEPPRPKERNDYHASPAMLSRFLAHVTSSWQTRKNITEASGMAKASSFRAEFTALKRGLIEAKTVKNQRLLRLSQPATEGTPE